MRVTELFDSLQGEGLYAGEPTTFIRLQGCNLRCIWCDTAYAQDPEAEAGIQEMTPSEIAEQITQGHWACITGGEPLIHEGIADLLYAIEGRSPIIPVEIETNGSLPPPRWAFSEDLVRSWSVDIKLPSSGNPSDPDVIHEWAMRMRPEDQLKMVIDGPEDLFKSKEWIDDLLGTGGSIILSPALDPNSTIENHRSEFEAIAEMCLLKGVRMSIQMHKIIWGNRKGV